MPPVQIDLSGLGQSIVNAFVAAMTSLFSPLPFDAVQWLLRSIQSVLAAQGPLSLLTQVPLELTTGSHEVHSLYRLMLLPNIGVTAIVLSVQSYRVMSGRADVYDVLIGTGVRLVIGQTIIFWAEGALSITNALSSAVSANPLDLSGHDMPNDLTLALMLVLGLILAALAWLKGAVGVVFVDLLLVSAPFIFSLSALPFLGKLGTWWASEATTWVLRPFMVALVIRMGLGIGTNFNGGTQFLFAIVAFWLAWTMDTRIHSLSVGAWGSLANLGLINRGARMAANAMGAPAAAPARAAAAATP